MQHDAGRRDAGRGISYARLEQGGVQWPCLAEDHPGTQVLHRESFTIGERASLRRIEFRPTPEVVTDEYPLLLVTGRTLLHFNTGTMTMRTKNIELRPADILDISADDAQELGLLEAEFVRVSSHYGEAVLPIRISTEVKPGVVFATFHTREAFLNHVTGPHRDAFVSAPEYKVTAVRIEKSRRTND